MTDQPYWIPLACDGCGYVYDKGKRKARKTLADNDWVIDEDGKFYCSIDCRDETTANAAA